VLSYANAHIVEDACTHIPVRESDIGPDGLIANPDIISATVETITRLAAGMSPPR